MERSYGRDGLEGKYWKDKGIELWYRSGPLIEFR